MKTKVMLLLCVLSINATAEVLNMQPFMVDTMGNEHYIEKPLWCYGSPENPCQYKGTNWMMRDPVGRTGVSSEIYIDCKDGTYGFTTPTTQNIMSGTLVHDLYKMACWK